MQLESICVFCGSSSQVDKAYFDEAYTLGQKLAERDITLVYGAGNMGLMGAVANSVLDNNGKVIGVIPEFMVEAGWHHNALTQLIKTKDMHERKQKMCDLSDAAIALPGGIGTFEELLEIITWKQLGLITKPIIILNTNGYYDPLLNLLESAVEQQFMREIHQQMWVVVSNASEILDAIAESPSWDTSARKIAAI